MQSVPIARLNRDLLQKLSGARLEDARVLLEEKRWAGSYYFAGLSVECALKACLAKAVKEYDYPDKKFVNDMYQHDLKKLAELDAALWADLQVEMRNNPNLEANWNTVKDWDNEKRYDIVQEQDARVIYDATTDAGSGVMLWIKGKW